MPLPRAAGRRSADKDLGASKEVTLVYAHTASNRLQQGRPWKCAELPPCPQAAEKRITRDSCLAEPCKQTMPSSRHECAQTGAHQNVPARFSLFSGLFSGSSVPACLRMPY